MTPSSTNFVKDDKEFLKFCVDITGTLPNLSTAL